MNNQPSEIRKCTSLDCALFNYRFGKKERDAKLTSIKTIRVFCLDCSGFSYKEVRKCEQVDCALYQYRLGKNPNRKGIGPKISVFKQNLPTELQISKGKDSNAGRSIAYTGTPKNQ